MSHNQLLSREDVINAYKFILGRAPESEQVIDETPWIPDHRRAASRVPDVERIWYAVSVLGGLDAWKTRALTGITVSQAISRSGGVGAQHWEASRDSGAPASAKPAASCDAASRIGEAPAFANGSSGRESRDRSWSQYWRRLHQGNRVGIRKARPLHRA